MKGLLAGAAFHARRAMRLGSRVAESVVEAAGSEGTAAWYRFVIADEKGDRAAAERAATACISSSGFASMPAGRRVRLLDAAGFPALAIGLDVPSTDSAALAALSRCYQKLGKFREAASALEASAKAGGPCNPDKMAMLVAEAAVRDEFRNLPFAALGMQLLLDGFDFETVIDVGCGAGLHAEALAAHGKKVTLCDYGKSIYFERISSRHEVLIGDFCEMEFPGRYDCVWASHVLEHQPDANRFLRKCADLLNEGGIACITVPPLKPELVGGHVSLWTPGHLVYQMVLAGFDCKEAVVARYGYNITVIAPKSTRPLPPVVYDNGDIDRLSDFFPGDVREGTDGWMADRWWQPGGGA